MSDLSAGQSQGMSGAAFDVFRNRGRSGVLLSATAGYLIGVILICVLFGFFYWRAIGDYFTWTMSMAGHTGTDFQMPPQSVMGLIPAYMLGIFVLYVLLAAYEAAVLRWFVRGESGGLFLGLGLGADTWRIWFGYWIWFFLLIGLYIAIILATLIVAGILGAVRLDAGMVGLVTAVAVLAGICLFVWVGVRLAPASATSVALSKFAFFNAWTVTRGRFWALFGSYLLLFVLYIVAAVVILGLGMGLLMGGTFARLAEAGAAAKPADMMAMFSTPNMIIGVIIVYGIYLVVVMMFFLALMGVNARAATLAKQEGRI